MLVMSQNFSVLLTPPLSLPDQSYKVFRPGVGRSLDRNEKLLREESVADTSLLSLHSDKTPVRAVPRVLYSLPSLPSFCCEL